MSKKRWVQMPVDGVASRVLQQQLNISPVLCDLLVQRGIRTFDEARQFFRPAWSDLHDPFRMKDMDKAVKRLSEAIEKQEKILLYGDYDVDGTTSVALMFAFLEPIHRQLDYYIPDRYKEGYGISLEGLQYAHDKGASLIIAMDCGVRAVQQVERARDLGIDMIICDHHLPEDRLPAAAAILDPKRADCKYPFQELSGCGIAFKLAQAYTERHKLSGERLNELLDFLVISIASDIVPITGENRVLAFYGLRKLNETKRPGLRALIVQARRQWPLVISDIVFGLAPMINAAGRLADADQAVRLMLAREKHVAFDHARVLEHRNKLRKEFDHRIIEEARALLEEMQGWESRKSIVLYQSHWHKGVIGIAASRMVEAFHRPSIILTKSGGLAVGSARSVRGFDIFEALRMCEDLLINFGGHRYAAGLTLHPADVPVFQDRFEAVVDTTIEEESLVPKLHIEAELNLEDITGKFWRILRQFGPFGPGNRNPVFLSRGVRDTGYSRLIKDKHIRLNLVQGDSKPFQGIAFGQADHYEQVIRGNTFDICYTIEENHWQGQRNLRLNVKGVRGD